jgi:hypothetical protein
LFLELLEFLVNLSDFALEDAKVLACKFLQLIEDLLFLFGGFLIRFKVLRKFFLFFLELCSLSLQTVFLDVALADFSL